MSAGADITAGRAAVELYADDGPLRRGLRRAEMRLRSWGDRMRRVGARMAQVGAGLAAPLAASTYAFAQFEDAMIEVQKVTSEAVAKSIRPNIIAMADAVPFAQKELASLAAQAARFGREGVKNITSFTRTVAEMATATEMNAQESAKSLNKLLRGTQTPTKLVENLGSAVNALSNTLGASADEIVRTATKAGASLSQFGLSNTQILGVSAALDEIAPSMRRAGTRLRRFAEEMMDPDSIKKVAGALGTTTDKLTRMQQEAPLDMLISFAQIFRRGGETARQLRSALTSGVTPALAKLGQNLPRVYQALDLSAQAFEANTSLSREFRDAVAGLKAQLQLLWNDVREVGIAIGKHLKKPIVSVADGIGGLLDSVSAWTRENGKAVAGIATLAGVLVTVGASLWTTGIALQVLGAGLGWLATVGSLVAGVFGSLVSLGGTLLAGVFSPLGIAIGGAALAAYSAYQSFQEVRDAVGALGDALGGGLSSAFDWLGDKLSWLGTVASETFNGMLTHLASGRFKKAAEMLWAGLHWAWEGGTMELEKTWADAMHTIMRIWETTQDALSSSMVSFGEEVAKQWVNSADVAAKGLLEIWEILPWVGTSEVHESEKMIDTMNRRTKERIEGQFSGLQGALDRLHQRRMEMIDEEHQRRLENAKEEAEAAREAFIKAMPYEGLSAFEYVQRQQINELIDQAMPNLRMSAFEAVQRQLINDVIDRELGAGGRGQQMQDAARRGAEAAFALSSTRGTFRTAAAFGMGTGKMDRLIAVSEKMAEEQQRTREAVEDGPAPWTAGG